MHDWIAMLAVLARVVEMDYQTRNGVQQADAVYIHEHLVETAAPVIVMQMDSPAKNADQMA
jgi:hypothetical protein